MCHIARAGACLRAANCFTVALFVASFHFFDVASARILKTDDLPICHHQLESTHTNNLTALSNSKNESIKMLERPLDVRIHSSVQSRDAVFLTADGN